MNSGSKYEVMLEEKNVDATTGDGSEKLPHNFMIDIPNTFNAGIIGSFLMNKFLTQPLDGIPKKHAGKKFVFRLSG